ncbi:uncharacterized protein K452DRAFT_307894 [Aplosporella prunicola CBS 121167]|uniref:Uncharacterized protein n=1 Tax=Aplosporella prunicola CBS 121167 TaxID=1176127 RepID=A0A6A6BHT7_9PEZI|nr:uncharacterized protein K452DRAFT_307894 [Aplosporella prunicola CBS 121167]KAF2143013.1 hypothetical protein K452DRAFT_307894 [Aplosporella prunicola CBS 121167]
MGRKTRSQPESPPAEEPDTNGILTSRGYKVIRYDREDYRIFLDPDTLNLSATDPGPYNIISPATWRYVGCPISLPGLGGTPGAFISFTQGLSPSEETIIDGAMPLHAWASIHVEGNLMKSLSQILQCVHEKWVKEKSDYDSYVLTIHAHNTFFDLANPDMQFPPLQPLIWRTYKDPPPTAPGPVLLHAIARPLGEGTWFQVDRAKAQGRLDELEEGQGELPSPLWEKDPLDFVHYSPTIDGLSEPPPHPDHLQQLMDASRAQLKPGELAVFYGTDAEFPAVFATPEWPGVGLTISLTLGSRAQIHEHLEVGEFFDNGDGTVMIGGDLDKDKYVRAPMGSWPKPATTGAIYQL